jgi:hypothetical protein
MPVTAPVWPFDDQHLSPRLEIPNSHGPIIGGRSQDGLFFVRRQCKTGDKCGVALKVSDHLLPAQLHFLQIPDPYVLVIRARDEIPSIMRPDEVVDACVVADTHRPLHPGRRVPKPDTAVCRAGSQYLTIRRPDYSKNSVPVPSNVFSSLPVSAFQSLIVLSPALDASRGEV